MNQDGFRTVTYAVSVARSSAKSTRVKRGKSPKSSSKKKVQTRRIGKIEIARFLQNRLSISREESAEVYDDLMQMMLGALRQGHTVTLMNIGSLEITPTVERRGVIPGTTESIVIPAGRKISFRTSTLLHEELRGKTKPV